MYSNISGIILAGGKSSRMGVNKAFLYIDGEMIISRVVKMMNLLFKNLMIITNTLQEYEFLGLPVFEDIYKEKGPLGGIHSGLTHSKTENNFVLSCDMPFMTIEMIDYIINYKTQSPVVFCKAAGYMQPLAGVYSRSIIPQMERFFLDRSITDNSFHQFLKEVDSEIINPESLPFYDDKIFYNVNCPEDYEKILKGNI
ncbi:MAG: molybdenum cofactor guanylyltransferase [Ignavibacteria bacterium]